MFCLHGTAFKYLNWDTVETAGDFIHNVEFLASLEKSGGMGPAAPRGPSAWDTGVHARARLDGTFCCRPAALVYVSCSSLVST